MARTVLSLFGEAYRVVIDAEGVGLDPTLLSPFIFDLNQSITDGSNALNMNTFDITKEVDGNTVVLCVIDVEWGDPERELSLENKLFDQHIEEFLDKLDFYFDDPDMREQDWLGEI